MSSTAWYCLKKAAALGLILDSDGGVSVAGVLRSSPGLAKKSMKLALALQCSRCRPRSSPDPSFLLLPFWEDK